MMSKFTKLENGKWRHEDIGSVTFDKKPPEWIGPYLIALANISYQRGRDHALAPLHELIDAYFEGHS
jgi:hypothetical protein